MVFSLAAMGGPRAACCIAAEWLESVCSKDETAPHFIQASGL